MKKMNFRKYYAIYPPEHLLELLRAGALFPKGDLFQLPNPDISQAALREFISNHLPALSLDRYEIWLRFKTDTNSVPGFFTLSDIESAHFYSVHRRNASPEHIIQSLNTFGIEVGPPVDQEVNFIVESNEVLVREQMAYNICKAWFGNSITFSDDFINQVKLGYKHQQSATPARLDPIPSDMMWARLVAYNPGLRKFDEKPDVLQLQDLQEILKRSDQDYKNNLKVLSDKHGLKFSNVIEDAYRSIKKGKRLSDWVLEQSIITDSYIFDLNKLLGERLEQENFIYSALLYLFWRDHILNKSYFGRLADNQMLSGYIKKGKDQNVKATSEALFTIVYAGGPLAFQKALIEARIKMRNIASPPRKVITSIPLQKDNIYRKFGDAINEIGRIFHKLYDSKKKEEQFKKEFTKTKIRVKDMKTGNLVYSQYQMLCSLFNYPTEIFRDDTLTDSNEAESIKRNDINNDIINPDITSSKKVKRAQSIKKAQSTIDFPD